MICPLEWKLPAPGRRLPDRECQATERTLPNVILTPHVWSTTPEANRGMAERAVQNIVSAEAGEFGKMDLLNPDVVG